MVAQLIQGISSFMSIVQVSCKARQNDSKTSIISSRPDVPKELDLVDDVDRVSIASMDARCIRGLNGYRDHRLSIHSLILCLSVEAKPRFRFKFGYSSLPIDPRFDSFLSTEKIYAW